VGSLLRVVGSRTQRPAQTNPATTRVRLGAVQLFEQLRGVCSRYEFAQSVRGRGELAGVNALNADERALIPPTKTQVAVRDETLAHA
jgi:acetylornithine/succinyldiaminopimelate/putrescine aminotransferase